MPISFGKVVKLFGVWCWFCFVFLQTANEGSSFYSPVQSALLKHVVSCRGFSKNVACQSWRVGYLISHPETVDAILNFHDPIYISVPILQVIKTLNNKQTRSFM